MPSSAADRRAWRGARPSTPHRCFREPDGQAPALAQGNVIGSPIRYSVPLLRDVMTAILVGFEWHGGGLGSGTGPLIYRPILAERQSRATRSRIGPVGKVESLVDNYKGGHF